MEYILMMLLRFMMPKEYDIGVPLKYGPAYLIFLNWSIVRVQYCVSGIQQSDSVIFQIIFCYRLL